MRLFNLPNGLFIHVRLGSFRCPMCGFKTNHERMATLQVTNCYSEDRKMRWLCYVAKPTNICNCVTWGTWMEDFELAKDSLVANRQ
jgi:hypothetical protein